MKKYLAALCCTLCAAAAAAQSGLVVQAGAFRDVANARKQAAHARAVGVPVKIFALRKQGQTAHYRVRTETVGRSEALKFAATLRRNRIPAIIILR